MRRALVVDDRPENLDLLRALLAGHGCEVVEAGNGEEALALARQAPPDVAITDLLMPGMDGFTLLRHWKADPVLRSVPLVVYTATYTDPEDEQLALDLGADAFVLKPAEPAALLARLEELCARAGRGELPAALPAVTEEPVVLREYSEALVRRLEEKSRQLELANRELRERETRLAASERRFHGMIERSSDVVVLLDAAGTLRYRSASGERVFGHAESEVLGHPFGEFVHPDDRPAVAEQFARLLATPGGSFDTEFRYRRPDGTWGHADATVTNWLADPDIGAVVGNVREITARKQAEAALGTAESTLRSILESSTDAILLLDREANVRFINRPAPAVRVEDVVGSSIYGHVAERFRPAMRACFERVLATGEPDGYETDYTTPAGLVLTYETRVSAVRSGGEITGLAVVAREVSERKRAEEDLRESERRYRHLFERNLAGVYRSSVEGRVLACNDALARIYGFDSPEELMTCCARELYARDEDREQFLRLLRERGALLNFESEGRRRDGTPIWLLENATPVFDDSGGMTEIEGVAVDITARKLAEARVEHLSCLYATLSQVNQAIVRVNTREELFPAICRAAVEHGGLALAWLGLLDRSSGIVTAAAAHGAAAAEAAALRLDLTDPRAGDGLIGRALATGRLTVSRDIEGDPTLVHMRPLAVAHGLHAAAVTPFRFQGDITGFLVLASADVDSFAGSDLQLLIAEMATDISFALDAIEASAERRRAEQAETRQRAFADATIASLPGIFYLITAEGRFARWNANFERVSGYRGEEIAALHPTDLFTGDEKELIRERIDRVFAEGWADAEAHFTAKDGTRTPYYFTGRRVELEGRQHLVGVGVDLTARRRAEKSLRDLAQAVDAAGDVVLLTDREGILTQVNGQFTELYGHAAADVVGKVTPRILKSGRHPLEFYQQVWAALLRGETVHGEVCNRTRDGRLVEIEETITPYHDERGELAGFLAVQREIGARKRAEAEARLLRAIALGVGAAADLDDALAIVLREVCEATGWAMGEVWLPDREGTRLDCHPVWHGAAAGLEEFREVSRGLRFARGEGLPGRVWQTRRPEWISDLDVPSRFPRFAAARGAGLAAGVGVPMLAHGEVVAVLDFFLAAASDEDERRMALITAVAAQIGALIERKRAEEALAANAAYFRSLIEGSSDLLTVLDRRGRILFSGPSIERVLGWRPEERIGLSAFDTVHPDDAPHLAETMRRALAEGRGSLTVSYRSRHRDGSWRTLESIGREVELPGGGRGIVVNSRDVTETQRLEQELLQSQKMEAVGRLAGGIAHDFNNILAAMLMQVELTAGRAELAPEVKDDLDQIRLATERAAGLTRQLLLFSRRQVMKPRELDLNETVAGLTRMLQRIIGEDVRLELRLHPTPLWTRADAGMLDQVLMNLAVNARDAMPAGGALQVETKAWVVDEDEAARQPGAKPGRYVGLRVSDTGSGIAAEALPRIFEPFFTTKEPGKGTGLGLATVFGIVHQHGGWLRVESEPNRGTTFDVYLPAAARRADDGGAPAARPAPRGGTETILLVEDDAAVRGLTRLILERSGYRVVEAASGAQAAALGPKAHESVALLLTDLVMPGGLTGQELAQRLRAERAGLKVIFMSGYSADLAGRELDPRGGEVLLQKPFTSELLLETVRRCLDG